MKRVFEKYNEEKSTYADSYKIVNVSTKLMNNEAETYVDVLFDNGYRHTISFLWYYPWIEDYIDDYEYIHYLNDTDLEDFVYDRINIKEAIDDSNIILDEEMMPEYENLGFTILDNDTYENLIFDIDGILADEFKDIIYNDIYN